MMPVRMEVKINRNNQTILYWTSERKLHQPTTIQVQIGALLYSYKFSLLPSVCGIEVIIIINESIIRVCLGPAKEKGNKRH